MLSDGQLTVSLAYCQQTAVRGDAQGEHGTRVLGGMGHLEGVQIIHLYSVRACSSVSTIWSCRSGLICFLVQDVADGDTASKHCQTMQAMM